MENQSNLQKNTIYPDPRRYAKKEERAATFVMGVISLLFIALAAGTIHNIVTREPIPTVSVSMVTVSSQHREEGIIIREERVYTNYFGYTPNFFTENRTRVVSGQIIANIGGNPVTADAGGIIFFETDGFEFLNPQNMLTLTSLPGYAEESADNLFKIISSNVWHIAAFIENERAYLLSNITHIFIKGQDFRRVAVTVNTLERREGHTFVIFSLRDFMADYLDKRHINFTLTPPEYIGLQIPQTALVNRTFLMIPRNFIYGEDNFHINRLNENITISIPIRPRILLNQEPVADYVFITQDFAYIRLGDQITKNGEIYTINQVVTDTGVFRVNNGVAAFTGVNITGILEFGEYFLLNPELNQISGLSIHDRIIQDAFNYFVYEGQIIF